MLKFLLRHARMASIPRGALEEAEFAYRLLYGVAPTSDDIYRLRSLGVFRGEPKLIDLLRRIRAATDTADHSSSIIVRMGRDSIRWVEMDGFRLAVDSDDAAVGQLISHSGDWEPHLSAVFRRSIVPGMSVIDVGANIGYFTMLAAHLVGAKGRVMAFEPNSENNRLLLLSRAENAFDQVQLLPLALSDRCGSATFSVAMGSNGGLRPQEDETLYSPQCEIVPTMRLDDVYAGSVDFIKMDIEGAEALALAGAQRILSDSRPVVSTEFNPLMMQGISGVDPLSFFARFGALGYQPFLIDKSSHAEIAIDDVAGFMAGYGSVHRIEDLLFRPRG
jgi:FkbM family methyltransferase